MYAAAQRFRIVARRRTRARERAATAAVPLEMPRVEVMAAAEAAAVERPQSQAPAERKLPKPLHPAPASTTVTRVTYPTSVHLRFGAVAGPNAAGVTTVPRFVERRTRPRNGRGVRTLNLAVAVLLVVLLAPVMALIALAVKLTSPGPVIYRQVRVGRDRRRYGMRTPVDRRQQADRRWAFGGGQDRRSQSVPVAQERRGQERRHQADRRLYTMVMRDERRGSTDRRTSAREGAQERRRRIVTMVHDRRVWNSCGQSFTMYKFRSMRVDAEAGTGAVWAQKSDPRVTPIGRFLRRTRLDELPQLFNVIRGDMNIVGPRPERPTIVPTLWQSIPEYPIRQRLRPGITGLAQVSHSYDSSIDDVRTKIRYDLEYMRRRSVARDLLIMAKTPLVMFIKKSGQ